MIPGCLDSSAGKECVGPGFRVDQAKLFHMGEIFTVDSEFRHFCV